MLTDLLEILASSLLTWLRRRPNFICTESTSVLSDNVSDKSFYLCICTNRIFRRAVAPLKFTKIYSSSVVKVRQAEGQFSVIPDPGFICITIYTIDLHLRA